jgi:hypothetical protein
MPVSNEGIKSFLINKSSVLKLISKGVDIICCACGDYRILRTLIKL